jgi:lysine decarboxylase
MNKPIQPAHLGDELADLLSRVKRILSDPVNRPAWQTIPDDDPGSVARFEKELSAVLSILDNSGSNPGLGGVLANLNGKLTAAYGAKDAQFVESGSSGANVRLAIALARALAKTGNRVVVADRFAHASVIGAAAIADLDLRFLYRRYRDDLDVTVPLSACDVEDALIATGAGAVWITVPTYDGFVADLRAIAAVCRRHGAYLIVDAAWGVLHGLPECGAFPASAIQCGAHAAVISLHKKGLGLSQASAAVFNDLELARFFRQAGDLGLMTTSPLYLLPASVQVGLAAVQSSPGRDAWQDAVNAANEFRRLVDGYAGCRVVRPEDLGPDIGGDPCHVLVNVRDTGVTGFQIMHAFHGFSSDPEMATRDTMLLLFGPEHADSAWAIARAFKTSINLSEKIPRGEALIVPSIRPPRPLTPRQALMAPTEPALLINAVGRIAAQTIGAYPPGQAIICLGEQITREVADYLFAVERAGGRIKGVIGSLHETPVEVVVPQ